MIYSERVEKAMRLAFAAHEFQTDKGGYPYIAHPIHLAEQCSTESETIVALLHDVIEDAPNYRQDVEKITTEEELEAIRRLTHIRYETYEEYVDKVAVSPLARKIKILDLKHNLDETRLPIAMPESHKQRYTKALQTLEKLEFSDPKT